MAPALLYTRGGGRLGNQLLNYANLFAFGEEHPRFEVVDLAFVPYRDLYGGEMALADVDGVDLGRPWRGVVRTFWGAVERRVGSPQAVEQVRTHLLHRLADLRGDAQSLVAGDAFWRFDVVGDHCDRLDLSRPATVERVAARPVSVVAGWGVRCWPLVARHADAVRTAIRPGERYYRVAEPYVADLRAEFDHVAGVLVRQDDYRTWHDGEYFFESTRYRAFMEAYAANRSEERVGFLIASDEAQPDGVFDDDRFRFATGEAVGPNHYLENFVELSLCDAVVTPPSTFSGVAAFVGDVPLVPLYDGVLDDDEGLTETSSDLAACADHPFMGDAVD